MKNSSIIEALIFTWFVLALMEDLTKEEQDALFVELYNKE